MRGCSVWVERGWLVGRARGVVEWYAEKKEMALGCVRPLSAFLLALLYLDAALRCVRGLVAATTSTRPAADNDVREPRQRYQHPPILRLEQRQQLPDIIGAALPPPPPPPPPASLSALARSQPPIYDDDALPLSKAASARDAECAKHDLLLGNLLDDLAPWIDRGTRIDQRKMRDVVNFVDAHRGKWDSWVTDTLTPILISDGKIYLTLGPPTKDPTNYFWTVLQELQELARTTKLPDAELLLNFANTPVALHPPVQTHQ